MTKRIYKYPIEGTYQEIEIEKGAEILSVQVQRGVVTVWAAIDTMAECESLVFRVVMTGEVLEDCGRFIGTVQLPNGIVGHVFVEPRGW